jgi:hypothetical protein
MTHDNLKIIKLDYRLNYFSACKKCTLQVSAKDSNIFENIKSNNKCLVIFQKYKKKRKVMLLIWDWN